MLRAHLIIQETFAISRSLSIPAKSCLPCKAISKWFRGYDIETLGINIHFISERQSCVLVQVRRTDVIGVGSGTVSHSVKENAFIWRCDCLMYTC